MIPFELFYPERFTITREIQNRLTHRVSDTSAAVLAFAAISHAITVAVAFGFSRQRTFARQAARSASTSIRSRPPVFARYIAWSTSLSHI
jgi:hypothetical protein